MRQMLTTVSLAALIASAGIAGAQTSAQPERQQQQQQRQMPSGGEERQRQPGSSDERSGERAQQQRDQDRQRGQAQQQQDQDRQRGQAQQQQDQDRQRGQAQQQRDQDRQRGQAQQEQQRQQQPSTAQPGQQPGTQQRQPGQAQDQQQQQRQPSQAQERQQQQRQPGQAQDQQQQRQPTQAQPGQQPGTQQQPSTAQQQQPAGSGEVSSRIASNPEVATRVQQSVTNIRQTNVNVDVRVGASIPRTVELQPVPAAIIEIAPRYREFRVIRVRDEIVIVNPRTYEVVEVIRTSGGARVGQTRGRSLELTAQQRQLVLRHVRESRTATTTRQIRVTEGQPLTEQVELEMIPQDIVTEVPTLREYRYFVSGQEVVIVDPSTNVVAEVIR